jgi:hypothetical protein
MTIKNAPSNLILGWKPQSVDRPEAYPPSKASTAISR